MTRNRLYFAYGSNLNLDDLRDWCIQRGYDFPISQPVSHGYVPDMELVFNYHSSTRGGGALNLELRLGHVVTGMLFEVSPGGWEALNAKEGAPGYYRQKRVPVLTDDGDRVDAVTYEVVPERVRDFVAPTEDYVNAVKAGMREFGISHGPLEAAARGEISRPLFDAVFVYGTLMRGECRHPVVGEAGGLECALLAVCPGALVDLGSFPAMLPPCCEGSWVEGEFFRLSKPSSALKMFDEIEGFNGWNDTDNFYERRIVTVDVGDGRLRKAWTYVLAGDAPHKRRIESGCWRHHTGTLKPFVRSLVQAHAAGRDRTIAEELADTMPWSFNPNTEAVVSSLLPLDKALLQGNLSERRLAQVTEKWAVVPDSAECFVRCD